MDPKPTILFICTGNYYRSRFAEEVFNSRAIQCNHPERADSAGLRVQQTRTVNPGPISPYTLEALQRFAVSPTNHTRPPKPLTAELLQQSSCPIAVCQREHMPMVHEQFPQYAEQIKYWNIEDIGCESPHSATASIYQATLDLLDSRIGQFGQAA